MIEIAEFRVRIDRTPTPRTYRVTASGQAGEASGEFEVPFTDIELENFVLKIGRARRGVRRIDSPEVELAKTFGGRLFSAVIDGGVGDLYRASHAEARASGRGLRFRLLLGDAQELSGVPWEFLYDQPNFLSISPRTPVVRSLDLPAIGRSLRVALPIRILGVVSAPSDAEPLDVQRERAILEDGIRSLVSANAVSIDWIEEANLVALTRGLRSDAYHVLHYIGHGGFDSASGDEALLFEDDAGRSRRVSGDQLGTILRDSLSLRLVLFQSGEGARTSLQDSLLGVAMSLVKRDIPAVVAMQFEMTDRAAMVFAGEFYSMLATGESVDAAITEARRAIFADRNDVEWATPVLFLGATDGRLFDIAAPALAVPWPRRCLKLPCARRQWMTIPSTSTSTRTSSSPSIGPGRSGPPSGRPCSPLRTSPSAAPMLRTNRTRSTRSAARHSRSSARTSIRSRTSARTRVLAYPARGRSRSCLMRRAWNSILSREPSDGWRRFIERSSACERQGRNPGRSSVAG